MLCVFSPHKPTIYFLFIVCYLSFYYTLGLSKSKCTAVLVSARSLRPPETLMLFPPDNFLLGRKPTGRTQPHPLGTSRSRPCRRSLRLQRVLGGVYCTYKRNYRKVMGFLWRRDRWHVCATRVKTHAAGVSWLHSSQRLPDACQCVRICHCPISQHWHSSTLQNSTAFFYIYIHIFFIYFFYHQIPSPGSASPACCCISTVSIMYLLRAVGIDGNASNRTLQH